MEKKYAMTFPNHKIPALRKAGGTSISRFANVRTIFLNNNMRHKRPIVAGPVSYVTGINPVCWIFNALMISHSYLNWAVPNARPYVLTFPRSKNLRRPISAL